MLFNFQKNPFVIRLLHWEYWPFAAIYGPILPVYFWYALRSKSFFFFSTSNPSIKNAGFEMESKFDIDKIIPSEYRPPSLYFEPGAEISIIQQQLQEHAFNYPLIVKPDIGGKGVGVHKVNTQKELKSVIQKFPVPFIIQPYLDFPNEMGLFFVKIPGKEKGNITGIVLKHELKITGDGKSSILQLLESNSRYILQIPALKKIMNDDMYRIPDIGKKEVLMPYGNHARGSLFLDGSHLISQKLQDTFNIICKRIDRFYYGRMDIKYDNIQDLEDGKNFSIIELNGAGSEPTHIYDPKHSLFFAWKEIIRHWKLLWKVSVNSKKIHQLRYMSCREGFTMFADKKAYQKKCSKVF